MAKTCLCFFVSQTFTRLTYLLTTRSFEKLQINYYFVKKENFRNRSFCRYTSDVRSLSQSIPKYAPFVSIKVGGEKKMKTGEAKRENGKRENLRDIGERFI